MNLRHKEDIAIIGIGCRLPGGIGSPDEFWDFLCKGGDAIRDVPADRWDVDALYSPDAAAPGKTYARRGGFLENLDRFDPDFFCISAREADQIDPQQRLLLETAHEAMEDAGERWEDPAVRNTGVFVGVFIHDYQHMQFADRDMLSAHSGTGTAMSITANRVSYAFDLHGPSLAVDTACSSSLVAVDVACKALLDGDCDYALAGGVNVILKPEMTIAMSKATMLSRDGSCKTFDAAANGYVRGEGAAFVLLRKLSAARAAGNHIYAVIRGTGVNSDGRTNGISVPNGDAQEQLIRRVLNDTGIPASSIQYVEAHGTGTPVGDPIEAQALGRVFSERRNQDDVCLVGSVKTNIGHLESASGVAGLIKAALCLKHAVIPANLHFHTPNPAIDFARLRLQVVARNQNWPDCVGPRRAAVNSFGFGGTNAHAILEQAADPDGKASETAENLPENLILPMGAHNQEALRQLARGYGEHLAVADNRLQDFLYTVSRRRSHGAFRAALVASSREGLQAGLAALAQGNTPEDSALGQRLENFSGRPVFVFAGMGPQSWAMARELLTTEPVFRGEVGRVDAAIRSLSGWSLLEHLLADEASSRIQKTNIAQPAIFAVQAGLAALWRHYGIEPAAAIGHSVGEVAALYVAGILDLEDAATVSYHRSRLQYATAGSGGMLAADIGLETAANLIRGHEDCVAVAAVNGPASLTLSGDDAVLCGLQKRLEADGIFARSLQVEVPYHSPKMESIKDELLASLANIKPRPGHVPYYSSTDGRTPPSLIGDAAYWWRNVRQTVFFAASVYNAIDDGHACFLELSPHPVLKASIAECLAKRKVDGAVVHSLRRGHSDRRTIAAALAALHTAGANIAWERLYENGGRARLPIYPWQRSSHWAESREASEYRKGLSVRTAMNATGKRHPLLGSRLDLPQPTWVSTLRLSEQVYLRDHKIQGTVVFPGTGYLEMALQTLADPEKEVGEALEKGEHLVLSDVEIGRALYLGDDDEVRLQSTRNNDRWSIQGLRGDDGSWVLHASGRARREKYTRTIPNLDLDEVKERCPLPLAVDYAYRLFKDVGLQYGPTFQAIRKLWYGPREALAWLELPDGLQNGESTTSAGFLCHPALLDACLHTLFGALNLNGEDSHRRGNVFLPVSVGQLRIYNRQPPKLWSHARIRTASALHFSADVSVYDESGRIVAEVLDLRCQALERPAAVAEKRRREWLLEYEWQASPRLEATQNHPGLWVVLASDDRHEVLQALRKAGVHCVTATPGARYSKSGGNYVLAMSSSADFKQMLADLRQNQVTLAGVIHALCLSPQADGSKSDPTREHLEELGACTLVYLVQALTLGEKVENLAAGTAIDSAFGHAQQPVLRILTDRTQAIDKDSEIRPAFSSVWGLRRVIANEHPNLDAAIVDLDGTAASFAALATELAKSSDDESALREGARYVHRLRRYIPSEQPSPAVAGNNGSTGRMQLDLAKIGDLKSMRWIDLPELDLKDREVEIEVHAAGLNFKDVMKATGLFPARLMEGNLWSRATLGMECAGRVSRVGALVDNLKPGDEVMALAPRSFASHTVTHSALVVPNPGFAHAAAAGIPMAFLTASIGLEHLARLQPGERVLIHAATGGVGQAAIQIARDIGAEVFATAGSEEKRALLLQLGVKHIFDSRSLRFAEQIRDVTDGQGVDVVLNSLAGDAIAQGVAALADYGRFVEIGKMDLDRDYALGLRPFTRCLSFHSVDLDRMLVQKVDLCGRLFQRIYERMASGRLRPLPVTTYGADNVAEAYQAMAAAAHTGKLVIDTTTSGIAVQPTANIAFRADRSYLISGGLGGFGLQLAAWLAQRGAGRLVLLGRRGGKTPGADAATARLRALGAEVQIEACDLGSSDDVSRALSRIPAHRPLAGVFHAAAVLDDALVKNMNAERYYRTFAPKAVGAWNLHRHTLGAPVDYFMCFSSIASLIGNQGSANYCAANAFTDTLAHYRHSLGLPALTVNWGVIADVGMAADEDFYRQNLERNGLQTIHSTHGLEMLEVLLLSGRVQTAVCPMDMETWLRFNPAGREGRLRELLNAAGEAAQAQSRQSAEEASLRAKLDALSEDERELFGRNTIRDVVAGVLRTDPEKISTTRSLTALGVDSLMAIEIKNRLDALGLALSVTQLLNRNSVVSLSAKLLESLNYCSTADASRDETPGAENPLAASWLVRFEPRENAKIRLFCFPYAGGGISVYKSWVELLPEWVELVAVSLPGRGVRADEKSAENIAYFAEAIVPEMLALLDRPFALFGHCMGAIVMYETAQRLQDAHKKLPVHIFASGCMAPHLYNSPIVHEQDDDSFLEILRLISFSGTRALIEDPELRKTTYPLLRGDFRAVVNYGDSYRKRNPLLAPITGLAADNDLFAAPKAMKAWGPYTCSQYNLAQLRGDHYFVESDRETVIALVSQTLAATIDEPFAGRAPQGLEWSAPGLTTLGFPPESSLISIVKNEPRRTEEGPIQVYCFPGGGILADEFTVPESSDSDISYERLEWRTADDDGDVRCVEGIVDRAFSLMKGRRPAPFMFYGHCLGALIAYELALRLREEGLPMPDLLVAAGVMGPHLYVAPNAHKLPADKLLELLSVIGYPFARRLREDIEFQRRRLPVIRADLEAMAGYEYTQSRPLELPITAISLRHDLWSYPLRTDSWKLHTLNDCRVLEWEGDHYAPLRHPELIHEEIRFSSRRARRDPASVVELVNEPSL